MKTLFSGFKDFNAQVDDGTQSKTRKKMNKKSHKGRVYGTNHPTTFGGGSSEGNDAGGFVGEMMHNAGMDGIGSVGALGGIRFNDSREDTKKENQRNRPKFKSLRNYLQFRNAAEEEESVEDLEDDDYDTDEEIMDDDEAYEEDGDDTDDWPSEDDFSDEPSENVIDIADLMDDGDDEDPFEFDDMDSDKELNFDDDDSDYDWDVGEPDEDDDLEDEEEFEDDEWVVDDEEEEEDFPNASPLRRAIDDLASTQTSSNSDRNQWRDDNDNGRFDQDEEPMNDFDQWQQNDERDAERDDFMSAQDGVYDDDGGYHDSGDEFEDDVWDEEDYSENEEERYPDEEDDEFGHHDPYGDFRNNSYDEEEEDELDVPGDDEYDEFGDEFDDVDGYEDEMDDSEYSFDQTARDMVDSISDDVIDKIDDATGTVSKWWREQVVKPDQSPEGFSEDDFISDEFEEEEEGNAALDHQSAGNRVSNTGPTKKDQARSLFQSIINQPNISRGEIIDKMVQNIDVTQSTAVSYYEQIAKEAGITADDLGKENNQQFGDESDRENTGGFGGFGGFGMDDQNPDMEDPDMEGEGEEGDKTGMIRTVDNAHLVYKRQTEDGSFEELWIYNVGKTLDSDVKIRHAILSGTDIPKGRTQSEDGSQQYSLETMGNAQMLRITGLQN